MENILSQQKKRLEWLDALRGFTMILVVAQHVTGNAFGVPPKSTSAQEFFTLFRMPLFFFVSGFLAYKASMIWTGKTLGSALLKKVRVQLVPTVVFLLAFLVYRYKDLWPHLLEALQNSRKGGYWFTWVLLQMFVVYYLFAFLEQKLRAWKPSLPSWLPVAVFWLLSLGLYESAYLPKVFSYTREKWVLCASLNCFAMYFLYFMSGNIARRYWGRMERLFDSRWFFPVVLLVAYVCCADIFKWHFLRLEWRNLPLTIAVFALLLMLLMVFRHYEGVFSKETRFGRVMQHIGTRTLDIYLIHYFFIPKLPMVGPLLKDYRPNIVLEVTLSMGVALVIVAFCCLTSAILRTSPLLKKYLFGRAAAVLLLLAPVTAMAQSEYKRVTNLPHVYIDTEDGKAITSKEVYVYATMRYVDEKDVVTVYDSLQIRGRGNSTWNMAKKPYRIKFKKKEKFLGKGYANAKSWTLLANCADKTMIRNALTSDMGDILGLKNNPAAKFVDFTLNGSYRGTYQISDHVEVRPHRVAIAEQDYPLADTSNITGGYLLEVDGFGDGNYFRTHRQQVGIRIHYPDEKEIAHSQQDYIKQYINDFEERLFSENFASSKYGYRPLVDSLSLAAWYIATELTANIDGFYSTYFYKEQDDPKIYWGPLWDYDIAYRNDWRKPESTTQMMVDYGYGDTKRWINQMWKDPWFTRLIYNKWKAMMDFDIKGKLMNSINNYVSLLSQSQRKNYEKWGINVRRYNEIVLYSTYDQYIADLKSFLNERVAYLDQQFSSRQIPESYPESIAPDATVPDYAFAYNPTLQQLHFAAADKSDLSFQATVYDAAAGRVVSVFSASEPQSISHWHSGTYIVTWQENGQRRSVKFMK